MSSPLRSFLSSSPWILPAFPPLDLSCLPPLVRGGRGGSVTWNCPEGTTSPKARLGRSIGTEEPQIEPKCQPNLPSASWEPHITAYLTERGVPPSKDNGWARWREYENRTSHQGRRHVRKVVAPSFTSGRADESVLPAAAQCCLMSRGVLRLRCSGITSR